MRRVSQARVQRRLSVAWLVKARDLATQLDTLSVLGRARLIKKNAPLWSEVKEILWAAGAEKCWYSEVLLSQDEAEVEHFRPKGKLSGEKYPGYWWLAFDWHNYRLAAHIVNVRRFNRWQTRAAYAALRLATDPLCVNCELPLLLDPVSARDARLLTFDQDGLPTHDPAGATTEVDVERVRASVEYFALDDGILNARRADKWKTVLGWSEEFEQLCAVEDTHPLSAAELRRRTELENQIADAVDQGAEFSAVAIAALCARGDRGWNTALLQATG
jgi:uncharacterized protein (TIGR02646 family)